MKWSSWQGKATSSASKGRSLLMVAAGALLAGGVSAGLAVAVVVAMLRGGGADSGELNPSAVASACRRQ